MMAANEMRKTKLKEVCDRITVGFVGPMADKYTSDGVPFLRSQNISPFRLNLEDIKFIPADFHQKIRKSALHPGDVAIVRTGYPGTACVIPDKFPELNCADLVVITPSKELNSYFLAALFNSVWGMATVSGNLVGVAQQHFNIGAAREMEVALPLRKVQDRIAGILSAYDELMENSQRRIRILEAMARAVYREWFVHFRFPGHAKVKRVASRPGARNSFRETVPASPGGGMNSALRLPEGWSMRRLDEVAAVNVSTVRRGQEPEQIQYVDISSVVTGRIEKTEPMAFADAPGRARRIVHHGDTIWSCVRPNRKSFSLILDPPADLIVSTGFAVLTPTKVPFSFLHQAVTTEDFVSYLTNHATGAAYPAVTAKDFEAAKLLVPDERMLNSFHEHCEPLLMLKENLMQKNANLRRTRDLLLPKLISGAVDVSKLDIETGNRGK